MIYKPAATYASGPSAWAVLKFGHWYAPKGGAHVELYPTETGSAFKYHYANGSTKDITLTYAAKQLAKFTEHYDEPKPGAVPKAKPAVTADLAYASKAGPGSWQTPGKDR